MPDTTLSISRRQRVNQGLPHGEADVAVLSRCLIAPDNQIVAYVSVTGELVSAAGVPYPTGVKFSAQDSGIYSGGGVLADAGASGDGAILHLENGFDYFESLLVSPSPVTATLPGAYLGGGDYVLGAPDKWIVVTHSGNNYCVPAYVMNQV